MEQRLWAQEAIDKSGPRGINQAMWYMYVLECNDKSYYVGSSQDVEKRVKRHNEGRGARYTNVKRPVILVYTEEFDNSEEAKRREVEVKNFSITNKRKLIKYGHGQRFPTPQTNK